MWLIKLTVGPVCGPDSLSLLCGGPDSLSLLWDVCALTH